MVVLSVRLYSRALWLLVEAMLLVQPSIDRLFPEPPMPTYLLTRYLTLPHKLIQRGLRNFQICSELIDRHNLHWLVHGASPDTGATGVCTLLSVVYNR
jgi:hypothetical protein